ncbi:MAG: hypothetical protein L0338_39885, partial [Acidobacteria bacterium]|nr:hypothetical protein [Acidobacteriota bacterium]
DQLEQVAAYAVRLNISLLLVLVVGVLAFLAWKYVRRQQRQRQGLASHDPSLTADTSPAAGRGDWTHPPSRPPTVPSPSSLPAVDHLQRG